MMIYGYPYVIQSGSLPLLHPASHIALQFATATTAHLIPAGPQTQRLLNPSWSGWSATHQNSFSWLETKYQSWMILNTIPNALFLT